MNVKKEEQLQPEVRVANHDEAVDKANPGETTEVEASVEQQLEALQTQLDGYVDRLQHNQADFENYKKRKEREQAEFFVLIEDRVIKEMLPLYDDFKRAFDVFKADDDQATLVEGVKRIFTKFEDYLQAKDVVCLKSVGEKFDPALHEVLLAVESAGEPNRILEQFEGGYTRQGRLLRPSRVTVSKRPPMAVETPPAEPDESEAKQPDKPDQAEKE